MTSITADPHCMKCRNKWNIEFTKSALNASFMDKDYRGHRKTILTDMAIAKIPEYYEGALRYAKISESDKRMAEIMVQISELRSQMSTLYREHETIRVEMGNTSQVSRKFVMPCQTEECRGMLSSQYKCDLCSKYTCPKCFMSITGEKDEHVCKQDDVDTVEELRKNTRPCPNCGMRISKIDGCDQMWCIECKTAFSWSKGTVERGVVHNPHYYQWMRERGITNAPTQCEQGAVFNNASRRIAGILSDCIGSRRIPNIFCEIFDTTTLFNESTDAISRHDQLLKNALEKYRAFYTGIKPYLVQTESLNKTLLTNARYLSNFHRFIVHMEHVEMNPLAENIRTRSQNNLPIYLYILNQYNKEQLADDLIRVDTTNMKDRAYLDIVDAFVLVGKQIMVDCLTELNACCDSQCMGVYNKFEHANEPINYTSAKFISQFVVCEYLYTCDKMAAYHKIICDITNKYLLAIKRYCAYSTTESFKFLLIYNSKKTLPVWNYMEGRSGYQSFKNKTEILQEIGQHKTLLKEMETTELQNEFIPNDV